MKKEKEHPKSVLWSGITLSIFALVQKYSHLLQEAKDRKRSEGDYKINLKSEIIVEDMHYKLDAIIARQSEILKYLSDEK